MFSMFVKNGILVENGHNIKPSEMFINTMITMLVILRSNMKGHKESEGVFRIIDNEDGILDGLLATTIIHYYKFHLNIETLDFKTLDDLVMNIKLFYPGQDYIKYANKVVYNNENIVNDKLQGITIKINKKFVGG